MRYLTLEEVLQLHRLALEQYGGGAGLRDLGGLESAVAQPYMTFGGQELYPTLAEKASALAYSLVMNHPFVDGNKRVGHAAMETFLVLNGHEVNAGVDEQEREVLGVASGGHREAGRVHRVGAGAPCTEGLVGGAEWDAGPPPLTPGPP